MPILYIIFFLVPAGHAVEWKENFGMEHGRCSEWNGMEDLRNGMENRFPYFHTNQLTTSIQTYNKAQSNTIDTAAYLYEHVVVSMVISQCVHILLTPTKEPLAVLNIRNKNRN